MKNEEVGTGPKNHKGPEALTDAELVKEVTRCAAAERKSTATLLRALIELDRRKLYLAEGYPSLYAYCTDALHYSEHGAFNRIEVARAAARWPQLLVALEDGSLHLAGARLLAPHLTADNIEMALETARHKSKRDIEEIAADLARRSVLVAVAVRQYRLHLTISREARDNLRQVLALISHRVPDATAEIVVEQALALLLDKLQRERFAATDHPRLATPAEPRVATVDSIPGADADGPGARSRHIPNAVKRAVWIRDDGRCGFVGAQGRCNEQTRLEFHHLVPFGAGGGSTESNLELRCRAHNAFEAELYYGPEAVSAGRKRRAPRREPAAEDAAAARTRPGTSSAPADTQPPEPGPSGDGGASGDRASGGPPTSVPPFEPQKRGKG